MLWFGFVLGEAVFADFLHLYIVQLQSLVSLSVSPGQVVFGIFLSQCQFLYQNACNE